MPKERGENEGRENGTGNKKNIYGGGTKRSFQLGLGEQDVPLDFRIVFHERELARQSPGVLSFDVEGSRACRGEELDEERGALFRAGHGFFFFLKGKEVEVEFGKRERAEKKKRAADETSEIGTRIRAAISRTRARRVSRTCPEGSNESDRCT